MAKKLPDSIIDPVLGKVNLITPNMTEKVKKRKSKENDEKIDFVQSK